MFKALAYKEWIKLRWFFFGALALGITVFLLLLIDLRSINEFNKANEIWNYIIFNGYLFYGDIKFIPFLIGLIFGIAQFYPEIHSLRLKLTLHLPVNENKLLFNSIAFGTILMTGIFFVLILIYGWITIFYFPAEILLSMIYTVIPWFLAGYASYFFTAAIVIEPLWSRRIIILVFAYLFLIELLKDALYMSYLNQHVWAVSTLLLGTLIFLSGFRFKRGSK